MEDRADRADRVLVGRNLGGKRLSKWWKKRWDSIATAMASSTVVSYSNWRDRCIILEGPAVLVGLAGLRWVAKVVGGGLAVPMDQVVPAAGGGLEGRISDDRIRNRRNGVPSESVALAAGFSGLRMDSRFSGSPA